MRKSLAIVILLLGLLLASRTVQAASNQQAKLWFALRAAAARHGATLPEGIWPESIHFSAPDAILDGDAPMEVRAISFDPALHQLRFRFRPAGNATAPWFSAWCEYSEQTAIIGQSINVQPVRTAQTAVSTRRLATLNLRAENSFARLQVRPLEAGVIGQSIRVRIPSNGHTLRARVTGTDILEAQF
jgi:hypothetical protein